MFLTKKNSYIYELPEELIAQYPTEKRSDSRLMHLSKQTGEISHHTFSEIIDYLREGDVLVMNKTKVIPARIFGKKSTGAKIEVFLLNQKDDNVWECLVKPGKRMQIGSRVNFGDGFNCEVIGFGDEGSRVIKFFSDKPILEEINKFGNMPLPPYIKRPATEKDKDTYQTVYAKDLGSVAAPTAGLHFTQEIFEKCREKGIQILEVTLNVGLGTFRPVKTESILDHKMHSELCEISVDVANKINLAKKQDRRVIAIGTTTARTLESFGLSGELHHGKKWTDLFIYPGKKINIIDGLITNFHMPGSTLLMLVSAFAGFDNTMNAYKQAVARKYRFFSYGDSMAIL